MNLEIENLPSAWKGHKNFAQWLIDHLQPKVTVELGVDFGYSTFAFAVNNPGTVYGIDLFQGDPQTGFRDTLASVQENIKKFQVSNIELIKGDFESVSKDWTLPIDILHIDGLHTYEAVSKDFNNWNKFVKDSGLILFHDTESYNDSVGKFFRSIQLPKVNFKHSAGLGVCSKDKNLIEFIAFKFNLKIF